MTVQGVPRSKPKRQKTRLRRGVDMPCSSRQTDDDKLRALVGYHSSEDVSELITAEIKSEGDSDHNSNESLTDRELQLIAINEMSDIFSDVDYEAARLITNMTSLQGGPLIGPQDIGSIRSLFGGTEDQFVDFCGLPFLDLNAVVNDEDFRLPARRQLNLGRAITKLNATQPTLVAVFELVDTLLNAMTDYGERANTQRSRPTTLQNSDVSKRCTRLDSDRNRTSARQFSQCPQHPANKGLIGRCLT